MITPQARLTAMQRRLEALERTVTVGATEGRYARCYGILATALLMLTFVPYDPLGRNAWAIADHPTPTLNWVSLVFTCMLVFLLCCVTVRPGGTAAVGWLVAAGGVLVGALDWLVVSDAHGSSAVAIALVIVPFVIAGTGGSHAAYRHRRDTGTSDA